MSGHEKSVSEKRFELQTLLAFPRWETLRVPKQGTALARALAEHWEPFAVDEDDMWLRRQSYAPAPAPLPPQ